LLPTALLSSETETASLPPVMSSCGHTPPLSPKSTSDPWSVSFPVSFPCFFEPRNHLTNDTWHRFRYGPVHPALPSARYSSSFFKHPVAPCKQTLLRPGPLSLIDFWAFPIPALLSKAVADSSLCPHPQNAKSFLVLFLHRFSPHIRLPAFFLFLATFPGLINILFSSSASSISSVNPLLSTAHHTAPPPCSFRGRPSLFFPRQNSVLRQQYFFACNIFFRLRVIFTVPPQIVGSPSCFHVLRVGLSS